MAKIKMVTYNIENGIYPREILNNLTQFIDKGVDIFCFQEVRNLPNHPPILKSITSHLGTEWKCTFLQDTKDPVNSLGLGVCWNKKHLSVVNKREIFLPKITYNPIEKLVTPGGKPSQRGALSITFKQNNAILRITTTHLDWQGNQHTRLNQLKHLKTKLKQFNGPEIICGDFNTVENRKGLGPSFSQLNNAIGLEFVEAIGDNIYTQVTGATADNTYPFLYLIQKTIKFLNIKLWQRLDYIFYKKLKLISCQPLNIPGSDHLPIIAEFKFL